MIKYFELYLLNNMKFSISFLLCLCFSNLYRIVVSVNDCSTVSYGSMVGILYRDFVAVNLTAVNELSCICTMIENNGVLVMQYRGVLGALIPGDCGALRFFARVCSCYVFLYCS